MGVEQVLVETFFSQNILHGFMDLIGRLLPPDQAVVLIPELNY
jgi:hypothetical protein